MKSPKLDIVAIANYNQNLRHSVCVDSSRKNTRTKELQNNALCSMKLNLFCSWMWNVKSLHRERGRERHDKHLLGKFKWSFVKDKIYKSPFPRCEQQMNLTQCVFIWKTMSRHEYCVLKSLTFYKYRAGTKL